MTKDLTKLIEGLKNHEQKTAELRTLLSHPYAFNGGSAQAELTVTSFALSYMTIAVLLQELANEGL